MPLCGNYSEKWKREVIQDHSFEYLDVKEFHDPSYIGHLKYVFPFLLVLRSVLMYSSDFWTGYNLAVNYDRVSTVYFGPDPNPIFRIIFFISIGMSCLLLLYEMRKAYRIIGTRDISFTYTNVIAHRVYVLGSYQNYCFFQRISASPRLSDTISFYVFFTLKGWKRLIFADAPREVIKGFVLYTLFSKNGFNNILLFKSGNTLTLLSTITLMATNILFCISLFQMIVASFMYIPLLVYIQGNLKEYCCHKIDKRITELLAKQRLKRQLKSQAAENRSIPLKNTQGTKKGVPAGLPQPTLPKILMEDENDEVSMYSLGSSTSNFASRGVNNFSRTVSPTPRFPSSDRSSSHHQTLSGSSNASHGLRPPPITPPSNLSRDGSVSSKFRPPPNF